jgi:ribose transport system ATP-binding protein
VLRDGRNAGTLSQQEIDHDAIVTLMVGRDLQHFYRPPHVVAQTECVEVRNLRTRRYPNRPVSFTIRQGEILGFAGLVGAGRSELAQTMFGVDRAIGGEVYLDNQPARTASSQDAIKNGIYLIPEDRRNTGLILDFSLSENITLPDLPRYSRGGFLSRDAERKTATEMCDKLNVKRPSVETRAANLSGGNQQKVVLAKWLSLNPRLLIFDEPTRGIDVGAKAEIYELMRNLAKQGVAIMMISSDMEEILGESDRVAVMHEGAITGILEREECTEEAIMRLAVAAPKAA